jgi:hypothetical protein
MLGRRAAHSNLSLSDRLANGLPPFAMCRDSPVNNIQKPPGFLSLLVIVRRSQTERYRRT